MSLNPEMRKNQNEIKITRDLLETFGHLLTKNQYKAADFMIAGLGSSDLAEKRFKLGRGMYDEVIRILRKAKLEANLQAKAITTGQVAPPEYRIVPRRFHLLTKNEVLEALKESGCKYRWGSPMVEAAKLVLRNHASVSDVAKILKVNYETLDGIVERAENVIERRIQDEFE